MPGDAVNLRMTYPQSKAFAVNCGFAGMFSCVPAKKGGGKRSKYECECIGFGFIKGWMHLNIMV